MTNKWTQGLFSAMADVTMGQSPPGEDCNDEGRGIPLLNGPTEFGAHHPTPVQFTTNAKKVCEKGDLLFCVRGSTTGRINWADQEYAIGRGIAAIRHKEGIEFHPFLKASVDVSLPVLLAAATGSTFPNVSKGQLEKMRILIPPLGEQRSIAQILGTLDDKIECNRRLNRTLEDIVRALFKSWFVDFDPVIDNALEAGKPVPEELADRAALRQQAAEEYATPLPDDLRALFPAAFSQTDEMGWIPEGWEVASLETIARLKTKTVQPNDAPEHLWTHFSIPAFDDGRQPVCELGESIKSGKYFVPSCSVLVSKLNPRFPRIWLPDVGDPSVSICSTEFMPFVPHDEDELPYLYAFITSEPIQTEMRNRATGSTGSRQRVKPKEIASMNVRMPPQQLRQHFSRITGRHLDRLLNNMRSIAKLSSLRDTLLPELLTGVVDLEACNG